MAEEAVRMKRVTQTALLFGLSFVLSACSGNRVDKPPDTDGAGGDSIAWGPRLGGSDLSPVIGAQDDFAADAIAALHRAARTVPNGASQSSRDIDGDGRTDDEMSVHVVRDDDGRLVHEVTDRSQIAVQVPAPAGMPRQGFSLILFTDLIPGIEPDLSSYPHEVLGVWVWEDTGEVGAFWSSTQPIPSVDLGSSASPTGTATYAGDAVGLHAAGGAVTKFLADVTMSADFGSHMVSGEVSGFRSLAGSELGMSAVDLGETGFSPQGGSFGGETTVSGVAGSGKWGARWSDGAGGAMGGTFGFAADDGSVGVLGAFTAGASASTEDGNPDDPVATN